ERVIARPPGPPPAVGGPPGPGAPRRGARLRGPAHPAPRRPSRAGRGVTTGGSLTHQAVTWSPAPRAAPRPVGPPLPCVPPPVARAPPRRPRAPRGDPRRP